MSATKKWGSPVMMREPGLLGAALYGIAFREVREEIFQGGANGKARMGGLGLFDGLAGQDGPWVAEALTGLDTSLGGSCKQVSPLHVANHGRAMMLGPWPHFLQELQKQMSLAASAPMAAMNPSINPQPAVSSQTI